MSSSETGCRDHRVFWKVRGRARHGHPALGIPAFLIALHLLSATSVTLAQCEVHEDAKLTASDAAQREAFGSSVSVSGNVAVVGAFGDDCAAGDYCGSAYVYRFDGSAWVKEQKLTIADGAAFDHFGWSVSVNGDVAVVGAEGDDCAAGDYCGSAYVYRFDGNAWVEEQKLTASDRARDDLFGARVSVTGDTAIVGALRDDCAAGVDCGSAYVYRFNGSTWLEEQKLTASDAAAGDSFGCSVSVSGDVAVVGAEGDACTAGPDCGSAYVYRFNGNAWVEEQKLSLSDAERLDLFGISVSVSADVTVVGVGNDACDAGFQCGSAYVYRFHPGAPGHWVEEQKLTASDAAAYDLFGRSVSVSGDSAVVGAAGVACGAGAYCGSAYVYRFNGSTWVEQAKLTASDVAAQDIFGTSVSVSGETALVGSGRDDCGPGLDCGSAYVYALGGLPLLLDCNRNGVADECDVFDGTSFDCNANGVPDECDIATCTGEPNCSDCNRNRIPDGCDIMSGTTPDCNSNAIPDRCDIAAGTSQDCNFNGIPDECEELPCPPATGACCDHDPFGGCTDGLTFEQCHCARCEWTQDASCENVACPHDSIPTVGGWGLAILSLLLMTGAKIRFGRVQRREA